MARSPSKGALKGNLDRHRTRRTFKPSTVWDHFLRLTDGNVQCIHCAKVLKRKDSSTKTMWSHLRAIHFKGGDSTVVQATATLTRNSHSPVIKTCDLNSVIATSDLIVSTQSWLKEQLGIPNSSTTSMTFSSEDKTVEEGGKEEFKKINETLGGSSRTTEGQPAVEVTESRDGGVMVSVKFPLIIFLFSGLVYFVVCLYFVILNSLL